MASKERCRRCGRGRTQSIDPDTGEPCCGQCYGVGRTWNPFQVACASQMRRMVESAAASLEAMFNPAAFWAWKAVDRAHAVGAAVQFGPDKPVTAEMIAEWMAIR